MNKKGITNADRVAQAAYDIATEGVNGDNIVYVSAPLCHVFFPYQNPGDEVDFWQRTHGPFDLTIEATSEVNPDTHQREKIGLPYGPKPRLIMAYLNTVIFKQQSPEITVGNSLTEFIGEKLHMSTDGRTINEVKNQLARLSTAIIKASYKLENGHSRGDKMTLIRGIDVWWTKNAQQRHLWGNYLRFSDDYYNEVMAHGVPLDRRALSALSGNSLAIDLYSFLAHRLHAIPESRPLNISWQAMKDQFGVNYSRMDHFKEKFRHVLALVFSVYQDAKIEEIKNRGFILRHSKPPIPPKTSVIVQALPAFGETPPPLITPTGKPFSELHLKRDPDVVSPRKIDEISRQITGKWDGQRNAKYKDVQNRTPKTK